MIVSVRRQEWFVFRRYAEFDKLYNTVSSHQPDKVDVEFWKVDASAALDPCDVSGLSYGNSFPP